MVVKLDTSIAVAMASTPSGVLLHTKPLSWRATNRCSTDGGTGTQNVQPARGRALALDMPLPNREQVGGHAIPSTSGRNIQVDQRSVCLQSTGKERSPFVCQPGVRQI